MPRGQHSLLSANSRIQRRGRRGSVHSVARMMYGSSRNTPALEEGQYGGYTSWLNPFSWFRSERPAVILPQFEDENEDKGPVRMTVAEYAEAIRMGEIEEPKYDIKNFNVTVNPKEKVYGVFDSVPRGRKSRKSKKRDITLF